MCNLNKIYTCILYRKTKRLAWAYDIQTSCLAFVIWNIRSLESNYICILVKRLNCHMWLSKTSFYTNTFLFYDDTSTLRKLSSTLMPIFYHCMLTLLNYTPIFFYYIMTTYNAVILKIEKQRDWNSQKRRTRGGKKFKRWAISRQRIIV